MRALSLSCLGLAVILASASAWAQEDEESPLEGELQELQLQEHRSELEHRQQMRELELDERRRDLEHRDHRDHRDHRGGLPKICRICIAICLIVHLLLTIWVYQDMRERDASNGLWLAIVLLSGLLGAAVYALVRIGDMCGATQEET